MKKIINYLSHIEIAIAAFLIIIGMFFPMFHIQIGTVDTDVNAWHAIAGIESKSSSGIGKYLEFSFLCALPFLLLAITIVLNVLFDNRHNIGAEVLKFLIFISIFFMFIFYMRLVNPGPHYNNYNEIKRFLSARWGNYFCAVIVIVPIVLEIIELIIDVKKKLENKEG